MLELTGAWRLRDGVLLSDEVLADQVPPGGPAAGDRKTIRVEGSGISGWDSALVAFLTDLQRYCDERTLKLDLESVPEGARRLVSLANAVPEKKTGHEEEKRLDIFEHIGKQVIDAVKSLGEMPQFLGECVIAAHRALLGKARYRGSDVLLVFQECGPLALPIVTLISLLVGMILAFVGIVQLEQFGADIYVANLVAVAMVRELGGMMTGIIMAGRTGAAFAAQLGTMQVNDEITAYRVNGIPPIEFLVLPRMLALILAVPLLTIYANVVGMLGGSVVTGALSEVSLLQYFNQTIASVDMGDWAGGLFKASVYGVIIAIAGCLRGMQCKKSAAAVGDAATSAVVTAITLIIVAEAVLTVTYTVVGI